jgi:hypothetical protein
LATWVVDRPAIWLLRSAPNCELVSTFRSLVPMLASWAVVKAAVWAVVRATSCVVVSESSWPVVSEAI